MEFRPRTHGRGDVAAAGPFHVALGPVGSVVRCVLFGRAWPVARPARRLRTLATYLAEFHDQGRGPASAATAVVASCFRARLAGESSLAGERSCRPR